MRLVVMGLVKVSSERRRRRVFGPLRRHPLDICEGEIPEPSSKAPLENTLEGSPRKSRRRVSSPGRETPTRRLVTTNNAWAILFRTFPPHRRFVRRRLTSGVHLRAGRAAELRMAQDRGGPAEGGTRRAHGNQPPRAPLVRCNALLAGRHAATV